MNAHTCQVPPAQSPTPPRRETGTEGRRQLAAVRLVVAAACDPAATLSVDALADRAGLHPWAVRRILDSPEYAALLRDVTQELVATLMLKGLVRLEAIIANASPRNAITAFRTVLAAYKVLQKAAPIHDDSLAQLRLQELFRKLDERNARKRDEAVGSSPKGHDAMTATQPG